MGELVMKKKSMLLAAVAMVVASVSCSKEPVVESPSVNESLKTLTFGISVEDTKTTLEIDGNVGRVVWEEGDEVAVYWKNDGTVKSAVGTVDVEAKTISVEVSDPDAGTGYYAVYPASATATLQSDNTINVQYGDEDGFCGPGSWKNANYMLAYCEAEGLAFHFKHISNALKFTISSLSCNRVQFGPNDGSQIGGIATFNSEAEKVQGTDDKVRLTVTVEVSGPGDYYVPVSTDGTWENGFSAVFLNDNAIKGLVSAKKCLVWEKGKVLNLGAIDTHLMTPRDYFITPEGKGAKDGSSWDDAGDADLLRNLLGTYTGNWRINGQKVYLSAGTYDTYNGTPGADGILTMKCKGSAVKSEIKGGYPSDAAGKTLEQDVANNVTLLTTTNPTLNASRVLYLNQFDGNLVFDGISFNTPEGTNYRAGILVNDTCSETGTLKFTNCTWDGCKNKQYAAAGQFASMTVSFENCTFKNNVSAYKHNQGSKNHHGGTVYITNKCVASFKNCTFEANTTYAPGSAVLVAGGSATFHLCTFQGNRTLAGDTQFSSTLNTCGSGTVAMEYYANIKSTHVVPAIYIDNCKFINNESATCAADIYAFQENANLESTPKIYVNRSYFTGALTHGDEAAQKTYFQAKSVWTETDKTATIVETAFYNCTFGDAKNDQYYASGKTYDNLPVIGVHYGNLTMANTTAAGAMGNCIVRNNVTASNTEYIRIYNCILSNKDSYSINVATNTDELIADYNIVGGTQNKYVTQIDGNNRPSPEHDGFVTFSNMQWNFDKASSKYFTFSFKTGKDQDAYRPVQYTTKTALQAWMTEHAKDFNDWLFTRQTNPYGKDVRNSDRNETIQHGSWDAGL